MPPSAAAYRVVITLLLPRCLLRVQEAKDGQDDGWPTSCLGRAEDRCDKHCHREGHGGSLIDVQRSTNSRHPVVLLDNALFETVAAA